jgi:rhodanese-related sulfurtransferase
MIIMRKIIYLLIISLSLFACQAQQSGQRVELINPAAFEQKMAENEGQVIDVRTPKEFNAGHIDSAVNMHVYDKDFEQRVDKLEKDKPVYVYCKVGGRSAEAVEILKAKGFTEIVELEGGMDAWNEAGKPVKQ